MEIEFCNDCNKPFYVFEHDLAMPGTKEREPVSCPYCHKTVVERITNGYWRSTPMNDDEIQKYMEDKK